MLRTVASAVFLAAATIAAATEMPDAPPVAWPELSLFGAAKDPSQTGERALPQYAIFVEGGKLFGTVVISRDGQSWQAEAVDTTGLHHGVLLGHNAVMLGTARPRVGIVFPPMAISTTKGPPVGTPEEFARRADAVDYIVAISPEGKALEVLIVNSPSDAASERAEERVFGIKVMPFPAVPGERARWGTGQVLIEKSITAGAERT